MFYSVEDHFEKLNFYNNLNMKYITFHLISIVLSVKLGLKQQNPSNVKILNEVPPVV